MIPFTIKYCPKEISEIVNQRAGLKEIIKFLNNFGKGKKAIIIYGPPGIGKTASIYAIANELNYDLVSLDSSTIRNKKKIENVVKQSSLSSSIFGKKKMIIIDEVDNFSGADRGGIIALASAIKYTKVPIVMTANDAYDPRIKEIRNESKLIQFKRIPKNLIEKRLKEISKKEKLNIQEDVIKEISNRCDGDLRAALNDLFTTNKELVTSFRLNEKDIFHAVSTILKTTDPKEAINYLTGLNIDLETIFEWLIENVNKEYTINEYQKALDYLSTANLFIGLAKKKSYYSMKYYAELIGIGGVVISKDMPHKKFVKYNMPKRIMYLYRTKIERAREKSKIKELAKQLHCSTKKVKTEYLPFIQFLDNTN